MREILFKGKRIDNGKWIQGYLFTSWEHAYILWGTTNDIPDMVEVDPATVCQYTGLTNKNGVKIFERDIVKTSDTIHEGEVQIQGMRLKVLFATGSFAFFTENNEFYSYIHTKEKIEVIGSIHDKKEVGNESNM